MLKKVLIFALFYPVCIVSAQQIIYKAADIAPELKNRANAVIRNMETVVDMKAPDEVILTVKEVLTVLNKNGEEKAGQVLFYNKNSIIRGVKGAIYDEEGKLIKKFSQSDFTDESAISSFSLYEDDRVKHFNPNMVNYPYTIVYEYEIRNKQNLLIPEWYATPYSDVSVEKSSYLFLCKPDVKLNIKAYNFQGQPSETKDQKSQSYYWEVKQIPAFKPEPYAPNPDEYRIHVKIAPQDFIYYSSKGSYNNWEELGKWIYTDLVSKKQNTSPEMAEKVKELIDGLSDPKEKARRIYSYVQQKTRYISVQIGLGGFQPMPAMEVDRLGYGDCKALVSYTQCLLRLADVPSYYCIVFAGSRKRSLDKNFASMDQANHVILCLPFKTDTTWLECTSQTSPFGFLGDFTDDRLVLACTENGGKILQTPILSAEKNLTQRSAELFVDENGNVKGKLNTSFKGAQYDNYEQLIAESPEEQLKSLKRLYDLDNINFSNVKFNQLKTEDPQTTESFDLVIKNYVPQTQSRSYLVLNAFNKMNAAPDVMNRKRPLYIGRGYSEEDYLTYSLPSNYKIEAGPQEINLASEFGTYHMKMTQTGNKISYTRKFTLKSGSYPAEKYRDFSDFILQVNRNDYTKVVFNLN